MRIIGGKLKGHGLVAFKASHIRPTTDRVKETIFNKLMNFIPEGKVLDLFSGTGSLGLEALSRGAEHVTFVESHRKSLQILRQNLSHLKIEDGFEVIGQDVFKFLKSYSGEAFDVIFIDPPFTKKIAHEVVEILADTDLFHEDTRIVIESAKSERIDDGYSRLKALDQKHFGDKYLTIFKPS